MATSEARKRRIGIHYKGPALQWHKPSLKAAMAALRTAEELLMEAGTRETRDAVVQLRWRVRSMLLSRVRLAPLHWKPHEGNT